ncbi:hypothetical protein ACFL0Q_00005, partial [Thermodesulfobacteriota bacterium]
MRYETLLELLEKSENIKNRQTLMEGVHKKIAEIDGVFEKIEKAPVTPPVSGKVQDLIKEVFAISADEEGGKSELVGVIALAKFGQFERAIQEFEAFLSNESL